MSIVDVSPEFYKQIRSLEASANEYLRHFWFLILPPPEGVERLSGEERGKKVGLMRDELLLVQKRGPELVHVAATNRWDSAGVEEVRNYCQSEPNAYLDLGTKTNDGCHRQGTGTCGG